MTAVKNRSSKKVTDVNKNNIEKKMRMNAEEPLKEQRYVQRGKTEA
jgi:hypothetical protein